MNFCPSSGTLEQSVTNIFKEFHFVFHMLFIYPVFVVQYAHHKINKLFTTAKYEKHLVNISTCHYFNVGYGFFVIVFDYIYI